MTYENFLDRVYDFAIEEASKRDCPFTIEECTLIVSSSTGIKRKFKLNKRYGCWDDEGEVNEK